ncbi:MAG: GIY-YIG nuclease family protein [Candidatus Omnitrophica bacterium]|nr:GIY-YIG nuclease family protein [Candidatus Omnitrophota bacterium]MCF7879054.1 GIY-YIG nuclease family protein [Candidatus Omnitrophota bacterium]
MMEFFVYILESQKDGSFYTGISKNPEARLKEHNFGNSKYTKGHRPYKIVYREKYSTRNAARRREKYLKSGEGRELMKGLLNGVLLNNR